ncbi:MAG: Fe2+-dependent dioxygenase [Pseudomonadota bacterium]
MSILSISGVLDAAALADICDLSETLVWQGGEATAGKTARGVKHNLQADLTSRTGATARKTLEDAITTHTVLRAAAQPARFSKLILSRTEIGGGYGLHMDNAFMGHGARRLRTDLSFTLFLSEPATYEGGALEIETAGATESYRPEAGTLVLYPSTFLHRVTEVTRGTRLACVGWIESTVKDQMAREILFDLSNLQVALANTHPPQSPERLTLSKVYSNLLRLHGTS